MELSPIGKALSDAAARVCGGADAPLLHTIGVCARGDIAQFERAVVQPSWWYTAQGYEEGKKAPSHRRPFVLVEDAPSSPHAVVVAVPMEVDEEEGAGQEADDEEVGIHSGAVETVPPPHTVEERDSTSAALSGETLTRYIGKRLAAVLDQLLLPELDDDDAERQQRQQQQHVKLVLHRGSKALLLFHVMLERQPDQALYAYVTVVLEEKKEVLELYNVYEQDLAPQFAELKRNLTRDAHHFQLTSAMKASGSPSIALLEGAKYDEIQAENKRLRVAVDELQKSMQELHRRCEELQDVHRSFAYVAASVAARS